MTVEDGTGVDEAAATGDTAGGPGPEQSTTATDQPGSGSEPKPRRAETLERQSPPEFDLLVVGGGSGGFAAAIAACDQGLRVGLVNTGPLGGTCTNRGCIRARR